MKENYNLIIVVNGPTASGKTSIIKNLYELLQIEGNWTLGSNKFWKEVLVVCTKNNVKLGLLSKGSLISQLKKDLDYLIMEQKCHIVVVASNLKNQNVKDYIHSHNKYQIDVLDLVPDYYIREKLMQKILNNRAATHLLELINSHVNSV